MKILLVQPPDAASSVFKLPFRPLTLELLAAYLERHETVIYDMRVDQIPLDRMLAQFAPDIIAVTCAFSTTVPSVLSLIKDIKRLKPEAKVIVGGVHPSLLPEDFNNSGADLLVHGPGEHTLRKIADRLDTGGNSLDGIGNVYAQTETGLRYTGTDDSVYNLTDFREPARHLTQKYMNLYPLSPKGERTSLTIASRGCPYRCSFCAAWKVQGGRFFSRSPQSIADEVARIEENLIYFFDDNAFGNAVKMLETARAVRAKSLNKEYQMWVSADAVAEHEPLLAEWAAAGLKRVFVGFESCDDEQLTRYHKRASVAVNERAHQMLLKHGVDLSPTFIVRYDFKAVDFERLGRYLLERRFLMPYLLIYTPLPGTDLWDAHRNELTTTDYEHFDLYHLTMSPRHMSPAEFMERFTDLYLKNPSWQFVAQKSPVARGMMDGLMRLRALYRDQTDGPTKNAGRN